MLVKFKYLNVVKAIYFITLLNSCGQNNEIMKFTTFPKVIQMDQYLDSNPVFNDNYRFDNIAILDSTLIILNSQDNYGFIKLYNKNTFESLGSFGRLGRGPNEFINPYYLKVNKKENTLMFVESPKRIIVGYKFKDILKNKDSNPLFLVKIKPELVPVSSYYMLNDSTFIFSTTSDSSLYTIVNKDGLILHSIGVRNNKYNKLKPYTYNSLYTNYFVYNEELNISITGYEKFDLIEKFDFKNNTIQHLFGVNYNNLKPEISSNDDILNNYAALYKIKNDKNYIYAPFLGEPFFNEENLSVKYGSEILVFDWCLKPIARLSFSCQIKDFEIDGSLLYIISDNIDNPLLIFKNPLK